MAKGSAWAVSPSVSIPLAHRDPSDPARRVVELAQRGLMILDVAELDLESAEAALGLFHPTTVHFRSARDEARKAWDRLRVEFGARTLEASLAHAPLSVLEIPSRAAGKPPTVFVPIEGQTYHAARVAGTRLAPILWRLTRVRPLLEHGPYYICRLGDGSTQCDCAEWTYRVSDPMPGTEARPTCKHLAAFESLGWI